MKLNSKRRKCRHEILEKYHGLSVLGFKKRDLLNRLYDKCCLMKVGWNYQTIEKNSRERRQQKFRWNSKE